MPRARARPLPNYVSRSQYSSAASAPSRASERNCIVPRNQSKKKNMATKTLRIAMEGVTGRLGTNQHLIRSLLAIRNEGGLPLKNGDRLMPEPMLLGRHPEELR